LGFKIHKKEKIMGMIKEIQIDFFNSSEQISPILRKIKFAAYMLNLSKLEEWVQCELCGYSTPQDLPSYRKSYGTPLAYHPYHGWILAGGTMDSDFRKALTRVHIWQDIGSIEDMLKQPNQSGTYHYPVPQHILDIANKYSNVQSPKIVSSIPRGTLIGVIENVRDRALNWTIEMLKQGIVGEGYSFNDEEKEKAKNTMTTYNIVNNGKFSGQIGNKNISDEIL
jgi:hypothetical protein